MIHVFIFMGIGFYIQELYIIYVELKGTMSTDVLMTCILSDGLTSVAAIDMIFL